jgi:heme-degrading monooxygenase HmoA
MKYARMTTVAVAIDKIAEVTDIYEQTIVPALKPVTGFLGAYLFTDPSTGEGFSLTFWANEQDASAYEASGLYAQLVEKLRPFFTKPPTLKTYQVAVATPFPEALLH